ncbi:MAG TPA: WecB/TagA/CpsF family glycosyltransferase [Candidatus Binatia bacterium]|jgi:N-acetylglucosaminyldiphosphoundecaprenol N-acetyl-beta-D-mannosaminyltransferase|nr:WecB/TagA/CpsF family glycosyltransferase [Candidatus Binatia bacterium]
MRIELLGVPIDGVTREEAKARVETLLDEPRDHLVTTPNPEMLVLASKDAAFQAALRLADLAVPDGIGLVYVARLKGKRLPERVTGTDLMSDVATIAARRGLSVYLLGGRDDVAEDAAKALLKRHHGLKVVGAESGGQVSRNEDGTPCVDAAVEARIRETAPDILFVAFGHGVQERWITAHRKEFPSVRLAMGVGGAFDFLAERVPRAPKLMRDAGLEWLWRLGVQPWRFRRIWTAVAVFPWLALRQKR